MTSNDLTGRAPTARHPRPSLIEALLWAAWFAGAAGLGYWIILQVRRHLVGEFIWASPDAVWMAPAAYLGFFVPVAVLAWVVARIRGGAPLIAGALAWLSLFSLLLPFTQVARWAGAILALGLAVQVARRVARRPPRTRSLAVGVLILAGVAAGAGAGRHLAASIGRSRGLAALPAPAEGAPNVLLIIWDTVRGENLSLYGYDRPTSPALDRLAATSLVFDRAISTAPWTLPSHGTLMTGRYGGELLGSWRRPLGDRFPTLAEAFRDHGYRTGGFVANLLYTSRESGLARGFLDYRDYRTSAWLVSLHSPIGQTGLVQQLLRARSLGAVRRAVKQLNLTTGRLPADDVVPAPVVTDDFLRWQASLGGRPFFAFLNYFDAHGPYRAPDSLRERLGFGNRPEDRYDAAIARLDLELGRLLRTLEERGVLDRTIVVVTADHGEFFGEHGLKGHANALYLPLLHVPLVIRYPARVPGGARVAEAVTLRDVAATILDLAGLSGSDPAIPGRPLTRTWAASGAGAGTGAGSPIVAELDRGINVDSTFPNARTSLVTVFDQRYHYVRDGLGTEWLFDYLADPAEAVDLIGTPDAADVIRRLRPELEGVTRRR